MSLMGGGSTFHSHNLDTFGGTTIFPRNPEPETSEPGAWTRKHLAEGGETQRFTVLPDDNPIIETFVHEHGPWGTDFLVITDADIEDIKAGNLLVRGDEYTTVIGYKKDEPAE